MVVSARASKSFLWSHHSRVLVIYCLYVGRFGIIYFFIYFFVEQTIRFLQLTRSFFVLFLYRFLCGPPLKTPSIDLIFFIYIFIYFFVNQHLRFLSLTWSFFYLFIDFFVEHHLRFLLWTGSFFYLYLFLFLCWPAFEIPSIAWIILLFIFSILFFFFFGVVVDSDWINLLFISLYISQLSSS